MPHQQMLPTWLKWNNANFPSPTGLADVRTGAPFDAGGLNVGDYFDATEREANQASLLTNGLLHWGRYRLVQVDSGATAANVRTGTVGFMRQGSFVQNVLISTPGSGGTPGIYTLPIPAGTQGGNGAAIQVTVGQSGAVTAANATFPGKGYFGAFLIPASVLAAIPGLTGAVLYTRMGGWSPNIITSQDVAMNVPGMSAGFTPTRTFIFLNSITPGNYGFVQELGLATVIPNSAIAPGQIIVASGTVGIGGGANAFAIGTALEWGATGQPMTIIMMYNPACQD